MKCNLFVKFLSLVIFLVLLSGCCAGNSTPDTKTTDNTETTVSTHKDGTKQTSTEVTTEAIPGITQSAEISVGWEDDFPSDTVYHDYIADVTENSIIVVLSTNETVNDFKFLSLEFTDVDDDGNASFNTQELFAIDKFTSEKPFRVKFTMFGTIPSYGISYKDADGTDRKFSIQQSGMDGSLILNEFE